MEVRKIDDGLQIELKLNKFSDWEDLLKLYIQYNPYCGIQIYGDNNDILFKSKDLETIIIVGDNLIVNKK